MGSLSNLIRYFGTLLKMTHVQRLSGDLPLYSLNFGVVTLLPKLHEAKVIKKYRPICMLNVSFKIFTKVLANRFTSVAQ